MVVVTTIKVFLFYRVGIATHLLTLPVRHSTSCPMVMRDGMACCTATTPRYGSTTINIIIIPLCTDQPPSSPPLQAPANQPRIPTPRQDQVVRQAKMQQPRVYHNIRLMCALSAN
jgi:hypothetical protein